jgi:hypothetical protein
MNESLVKYLAGLLDADGCLSFDPSHGYDKHVRVSLRLGLVAADSIDRNGFIASLPELTGMGKTHRTYDRYTTWLVCHRSDLEKLLPRVIKHMVIKARHWQWMLEFWRNYRTQERGRKFLTQDEWRALRDEYKQSRRTRVGPIKPKNRPTWAWLAGYLDGDGCFSFRTSKNKNMRLSVTAHADDAAVLHFLQTAFGGTVKPGKRPTIKVWWRGLGPQNASFAIRFLPKLVKHSRLKKHKIEQMIHFHRQRLSVSGAAA